MGRTALVGFHAAYFDKEGLPESRVGNALIGSYLTQIGLSETAVVYMTQAAPTELTLLTLQDAERIGIEVLPFDQHAPTTEPAQRITPREPPRNQRELSKRALSFVNLIHSKWSETNTAGLAWLDPLYADEVKFYGNTISRAEILTVKRLFTERWPERNYRIQPTSQLATFVPKASPIPCNKSSRSVVIVFPTTGAGAGRNRWRCDGLLFGLVNEFGTAWMLWCLALLSLLWRCSACNSSEKRSTTPMGTPSCSGPPQLQFMTIDAVHAIQLGGSKCLCCA